MKKKWAQSDQAFGMLFCAVFLLLFVHAYWKHEELRFWQLGVAVLFLLVALIAPQTLKPLNKAWMKLGDLLGLVFTPIIMGVLFFIAVTGMSILMKIFRAKFMPIRLDPAARSYWVNRDEPVEKDRLKFQF